MAAASHQHPTKGRSVSGHERVERGIRRLASGRYEVRVHVGRDPLTGRQRQVSRVVKGGIRMARAKRAELETEVGKGLHGGTASTVGYLFDAWNAHRERSGASPTTLAEDRRKIDRDIRPVLGGARLDKLAPKDLDDLYGRLLARGLSRQTVLHVHRIIHAALEQAVSWDWVTINAAKRVRPPRPREREDTTPLPAEVQTIITEAAKSRTKDMAGIVTVGALAGLRDGELCGLRLCDVDWAGSTITIRNVVWQAGGKAGTKAPKSDTGAARPLPIDQLAMAVLEERRRRMQAAADVVGVALAPDAYVWSIDPLGQTPLKPKSVSQAFRRIRDRVGVRARLHDLRHFAGTEMVAAGVDPRTVAERMRHADPAFTMRRYVTGRAERSREAAAVLGRALMPGESTPDATKPPAEAGGAS